MPFLFFYEKIFISGWEGTSDKRSLQEETALEAVS